MSDDLDMLWEIARKNLSGAPLATPGTTGHFVESISRWLAEWCAEKKHRTTVHQGCCSFILSVDIASGQAPVGYNELRFFKASYRLNLAQSIYVTDYALNQVHCLEVSTLDIDAAVNGISKAGFEKQPAIVFDVETQRVFVFENGVAGSVYSFALRAPLPQPFDFSAFVKLLALVHDEDLEYPIEHPKLWKDAKNRIPCEETERVVQLHLVCALKWSAHIANQQGCGWIIARESEHNAGRTDITVRVANKCIVAAEIKVLRYCRCPKQDKDSGKKRTKKKKAIRVSDKFNEWWALRGAKQAHRYKQKEKADEGVLLLYDMREKNQDIASVVSECKSLAVHHQRYYLQNAIP